MIRNISHTWGILGICLLAFIAIAVTTDQIFEHVPHSEDEVAYLFQAKVFAQNRLTAPTPPHRHAFWSPFVVDYQGHRFGKYPIGWPLLLNLGVRLGHPWLINAVLGCLTLALLGWLGRYLYTPKMGIGAAALGLLTPGFLFQSSSLLSHTASLFWVTIALVALASLAPNSPATLMRNSRSQHLLSAIIGAALGATFITRPFAAFGIGLAVGSFFMILVIRAEIKVSALLTFLVAGSAVAAMLPLYWWTITGDPSFNPYLLIWPYDRVGFGPDIGPYGYDLTTALLINTRLKLETVATGLFGWPGWSNLLFLPIPFITGKAKRWDWFLLSLISSMVFIHIFYWAFGGADGGFPRYYYDAFPAFILLTVRGIFIVAEYLKQWQIVKLGVNASWGLSFLLVLFI
ncbi:MAG: hypothetical protein AAF485_26290, partial [Chloroflexota bacterium]